MSRVRSPSLEKRLSLSEMTNSFGNVSVSMDGLDTAVDGWNSKVGNPPGLDGFSAGPTFSPLKLYTIYTKKITGFSIPAAAYTENYQLVTDGESLFFSVPFSSGGATAGLWKVDISTGAATSLGTGGVYSNPNYVNIGYNSTDDELFYAAAAFRGANTSDGSWSDSSFVYPDWIGSGWSDYIQTGNQNRDYLSPLAFGACWDNDDDKAWVYYVNMPDGSGSYLAGLGRWRMVQVDYTNRTDTVNIWGTDYDVCPVSSPEESYAGIALFYPVTGQSNNGEIAQMAYYDGIVYVQCTDDWEVSQSALTYKYSWTQRRYGKDAILLFDKTDYTTSSADENGNTFRIPNIAGHIRPTKRPFAWSSIDQNTGLWYQTHWDCGKTLLGGNAVFAVRRLGYKREIALEELRSSRFDTYTNTTIGVAASELLEAEKQRHSVKIKNAHNTAVLYIGSDSSVTTSNGMPIPPRQVYELIGYTGAIWLISDTAGTDVRYRVLPG